MSLIKFSTLISPKIAGVSRTAIAPPPNGSIDSPKDLNSFAISIVCIPFVAVEYSNIISILF